MTEVFDPLISADEFLALSADDVAVIDATWFLGERRGRDAYNEAHIPGAHFFDLDAVVDTSSDLPHMLPSAEVFAEATSPMLDGKSQIVVYDASPLRSAARVWWTFRVMGFDNVRVLNGGLDAYVRAGGEVSKAAPSTSDVRKLVNAELVDHFVVNFNQVSQAFGDEDTLIIDARSAGRFEGREPEPRPGLPSGSMPGSVNVPFAELYDGDGLMLSREALAKRFEGLPLDRRTPVIASCGSGVTACCVLLALTRLGYDQLSVYDGAWAEWGSRSDRIENRSQV
ncbi:MAG: rhodanese-like domain-containing protein [Pseudomonadota bacterium]